MIVRAEEMQAERTKDTEAPDALWPTPTSVTGVTPFGLEKSEPAEAAELYALRTCSERRCDANSATPADVVAGHVGQSVTSSKALR